MSNSNFFISLKIKPGVTSIDFTTKKRIFTTFWYQNCINCKVLLPIRILIMDMVEIFLKSPKSRNYVAAFDCVIKLLMIMKVIEIRHVSKYLRF